MKRKHFYIILFLYIFLKISSNPINNIFIPENNSSVKFDPKPGLYNRETDVSITSDEGKIFYLMGSSFYKNEPVEYDKPLFLNAEEGMIKEHKLNIILERYDGRIEYITAEYYIDRTDSYLPELTLIPKDNFPFYNFSEAGVIKAKDGISLKRMNNDSFSISSPHHKEETLTLKGEDNLNLRYIISGKLNDRNYYLYDYFDIDKRKPLPPEIGADMWGKKFNQDLSITINNPNKEGQIYYRLREWDKSEIIRSHPADLSNESWKPYNEPLKITTENIENIFSISAFIRNKHNIESQVIGPFYFKIQEDGDLLEQFFDSSEKKETLTKNILINGKNPFNENMILKTNQITIEFENHSETDKFSFNYISKTGSGKSNNLPACGKYILKLEGEGEYEFNFAYSDGVGIFNILAGSNTALFPRPVKYNSNFMAFPNNTQVKFYMPESGNFKINTVKNDMYSNINNELDFNGYFNAEGEDGKETKYQLNITELNRNIPKKEVKYYISIDKRKPDADSIKVVNYNPQIIYNDTVNISVENIRENEKLYYRFNNSTIWQKYDKSITLSPKNTSLSTVTVYFKTINSFGEEKNHETPYTYNFDRRGIFVNPDFYGNFSNGTEKFPVRTIQRAIDIAERRDIKIIYLMSEKNNIGDTIEIKSDIIIQPFNRKNRSSITLNRRSNNSEISWFYLSSESFLDLRNLDINIKSGSNLVRVQNAKFTIYNSAINIENVKKFTAVLARDSRAGISNCIIKTDKNTDFFTLSDINKSNLIISDLTGEIISGNVELIKSENHSNIEILKNNLKIDASKKITLINSSESRITSGKLIFNINSSNAHVKLFEVKNSDFLFENTTVNINSENGFNNSIFNFTNSKGGLILNQLFFSGGNDCIGINAAGSTISIERTMIDISNTSEYSYNLRAVKSEVFMSSSILTNRGTDTAIASMLNSTKFTGINNSYFISEIKSKAYNFWIDKSVFSSLNSLYYTDNRITGSKSFIFLKNDDYSDFKPVWLSNIISTDIVKLENINNTDSDILINDFLKNNTSNTLDKTFDLDSKFYFIPKTKEQIGELGITAERYAKTPDKDFFGNPMTNHDNIDIGAVQFTGK